ncbi:MAG: MliC family protein [Bacteroides intestinalis]|nr:MliC family protein [Bacteroides intestinalis]
MTKKILFITVLTVLLVASCKETPKQESNVTPQTEAAKVVADGIVKTSLTDKDGKTLEMTFDNSKNTATISLNSGERIELTGQKPASGIWYKNDHYELRGKGDKVELTKDGKTIFKN